MSKIRVDQPLVPSVLDRLLDDDPELARDPGKSRHQVLRELKQSVRRDLEDLLNTRRYCLPVPDGLTELERSLVTYGLPDFTGANLGSAENRDMVCRLMETVLRICESRFQSVRVQPIDNTEPLDRTLRFRIDALLYAYPAPEPVAFDSALRPVTHGFEVKGVN